MSTPYAECADVVQRLHAAVLSLERAGALLQLAPLEGREWFDLLRQKLLPQLVDDAFLVVAVVGGTNIGKSVIFNHIAGSTTSAVSPLASGTKHPVCLVPPGFADRHDLAAVFSGFHLFGWSDAEAPLEEHDEDRLFWKTCAHTPDNLLVLDTPDIDSDAEVNWHRADIIRRSADVLIAILTQQKYNDAAVKQFFRKASAEDKAVIVIFNQCQLPDDEQYWPLWLKTFCRETRIQPEFLYIVPSDRRAADENRLPFYERCAPADTDNDATTVAQPERSESQQLGDVLSQLRFEEIKLRTLRGSLRCLIDPNDGLPRYLSDVKNRSAEFLSAAERLSMESVVKVRDWPTVPKKLIVQEVRRWWKARQEGWSLHVHRFYDSMGNGITWPFRFARDHLRDEPAPPFEEYRNAEWSCVLRTVEELFDKLSWMSESASDLLRPHFERLLAGRSREDLLLRLRSEHQKSDLEAELEAVVATQMQSFQQDSPEAYRFYRRLNNVSAAARPVTSVVLFTLGWGPAGEIVAPFVASAAAQAVVPIVADFAGGTATALAGETVITGAASQSAGLLQAKFQKLETAFTARRAGWLVQVLKADLLGSLPEEFQSAAHVPHSDEFKQVVSALDTLETQLNAQSRETIA